MVTIRDLRSLNRSERRRPIQRAGSGQRASVLLGVRRRSDALLSSTVSRLAPSCPREAAGAPAPLPSPWSNGSISNTVSRFTMSYTARANVWAKTVHALPVPCFVSKRVRYFWPTGLCRSKSPAASENAHVREALPIFAPEVP
jgi:hypothetical protein